MYATSLFLFSVYLVIIPIAAWILILPVPGVPAQVSQSFLSFLPSTSVLIEGLDHIQHTATGASIQIEYVATLVASIYSTVTT